nr:TPA_inf: conotoxin precursor Cver01 [Conus judaeus]
MNCLQLLLVLLLISTIAALYQDGRATQRRAMSNLLNIQTRQCPTGCPVRCPDGNECCEGVVCTYNEPGGDLFCIGCGGGGGE